jgi:gliding motility-associated-like protein
MKFCIYATFICLISFGAYAQGGKGGGKPKIVAQKTLSTIEEQAITIQLTDLTVEDRDDWFYPWGFTLKVYSGSDYNVDGNTVIPVSNFTGTLKVPVTVNDGDEDSNTFDLAITVNAVNDAPVITGGASLSTDQNQSITITLQNLTVSDPDDAYPNDFTLKILPGNNYSIDGNNVVPSLDFTGSLSVNITVNDGEADANTFSLQVEVKPLNRVPEIVGQSTLVLNEDQSLTILLNDLTVTDGDNNYPAGFTLTLGAGTNYSVTNNKVTPSANFFGKLSVPATVNDGVNTSKAFNLVVTVMPVNDLPEITNLESEPLRYGFGNPIAVSQTVEASDLDGDSIMFAEVGIRMEGYNASSDKLIYTPVANANMRGVFDANTGILTLLGQASPYAYTQALRSVLYNSVSEQPQGSKTIYFILHDGRSDSEAKERTLGEGAASISLEIPTGFTPNGDLANDTWKIIPVRNSNEYSKARIRVYNKAGNVVYESVGFQNEWDGRLNGELLPADTYFYTIDLKLDAPEGYLKGLVTILR